MTQDRLGTLVILSLENDFVKEVMCRNYVLRFADANAKKCFRSDNESFL